MKQKWVLSAKRADFNAIAKHFNIDPVIARIMRNRDLVSLEEMEKYLNGGRDDLYNPHLLKDADLAADIIMEKIKSNASIRIIGDYDVDGIQSTYILLKGITRLGGKADNVIPDRIADGYGLNEHLVTRAYEDGIDTIITCDNGISAYEQIALAKKLGMTVVVTDHHEVPFEMDENGTKHEIIVPADAVVDPKQETCGYPFKEICGAVVAFKFIQILYEKMGVDVSEADTFIENAGFATVCDVMNLVDENRILVKLALKMINHTENIGMKALIMQSGIEGDIKAHHIAFRLGPCLNASGRLESAAMSVELLSSTDPVKASVLAAEIVATNESRKLLTAAAVEEAIAFIESNGYADDQVMVVYLPDCHESIAGIVAGRIKEQYYRPALVITNSENGAKGSGRSIEGYNMFEKLSECKELFTKFGGHPMAAGFSLAVEDIDRLRIMLNEKANIDEKDLVLKLSIDVPMPVEYITMNLVNQLELLEPLGRANEKPVFALSNLKIAGLKIFGKNRNVLRITFLNESGRTFEGVYFGNPEDLGSVISEAYGQAVADDILNGRCVHDVRVKVTYYPRIDTYYGTPRLQINITGFNN